MSAVQAPPRGENGGAQEALQKNRQWVNRYAPRHLGEVIGNTDLVRKLAEWLRDWEDVCLHGKLKELKEDPDEAWKKFGKTPPANMNARAALISGPPGIGKTTTCVLVANCVRRYDVMEFNASDARNKAVIDRLSGSLAGNTTLQLGKSKADAQLKRPCIIMDEVDGMAGGDTGGSAALIQMIKNTKNPIICICNDRQDKAVRELAGVCLDLKFKRPSNALLAKRVNAILGKEASGVDSHILEALVEACGNDMRQVMNQVQMMGGSIAGGSNLPTAAKDQGGMMNPFMAAQKLLSAQEARHMDLEKRLDLYWLDESLMPQLVHQNYLTAREKPPPSKWNPRGSASKETAMRESERCAQAAELIALGDVMQNHILVKGDFSLSAQAASVSTIYPATIMDGQLQRAQFPVYLQKRGQLSKSGRLVRELHARVRPHSTASHCALTGSSYLEGLYRNLMDPLLKGDSKKGAEAVLEYGLPKDCLREHFATLRPNLGLDDAYARRVDSKVKRAFLEEIEGANEQLVKKTVSSGTGVKRKKDAFGKWVEENVEGDGEGGEKADTQPKKKAKKKDEGQGAGFTKWIKVSEADAAAAAAARAVVRPTEIIFRFIEGHTNAVRRRVLVSDLLADWHF